MDKLKKHFRNNFAIYVVLLACLVILLITLFYTREESPATVDTSMFKVLTLEDALKLFDDDSAKLLVISVSNCSATINFVPSLQIAQAKYGYTTYYLELDNVDSESEQFTKLMDKLDMEYNFKGNTQKFSYFIGSTPMTIIIKNKKMVSGYIGSMNTEALKALTNKYGVSTIETD